MEALNKKLIGACNNNDYEKIEKYLSQGADPCVDDECLIRDSVFLNDTKLLNILLNYINDSYVNGDIINIACAFNRVECVKLLYNKINYGSKFPGKF